MKRIEFISETVNTSDPSLVAVAERFALEIWESHVGEPEGMDTWHGDDRYDCQLDNDGDGGPYRVSLCPVVDGSTDLGGELLSAEVRLWDSKGREVVTDATWRGRAGERWCSDDLEIEETAAVMLVDSGAWVQAWVYVEAGE